MTKAGLQDIRLSGYLFELDLNTLLAGSFPTSGDAEIVRTMFEVDIGHNRLGIGVYKSGAEIRFAYPIAIAVGAKPR
jgi:hypothetical protein